MRGKALVHRVGRCAGKGGSSFFFSAARAGKTYEWEADAVAKQMVQPVAERKQVVFWPCSANGAVIQRQEMAGAGSQAAEWSGAKISSRGESIDPSTRSFFESGLGADFSAVRIHQDAAADRKAAAFNARAFAQGPHIVFAQGEYQPSTFQGKKLLAHELVHVLQQRSLSHSAAGGQGLVQRKGKEEEIPAEIPCQPKALSRKDFLAATKTTDFGLTQISVSQADLLSSPYIELEKAGSKVSPKALTLNMPQVSSFFVESSQFIEGKTKNRLKSATCDEDFYPINWNITSNGASSLAEAEQEHCNDYNYAYAHCVYPFLREVNKATAIRFNSPQAIDSYLKKKLGFDPHDWFSRFSCMLSNSTIRDHPQNGESRAWHEPNPVVQGLPSARTNCAFVTLAIAPQSFSGLKNTHPAADIISSGC